MDNNDALEDDLTFRLHRLDLAWHAMYGTPARPYAEIARQAAWWVSALRGTATVGTDNPEPFSADLAAGQVLQYLIGEEATSSTFWGTELGRTLARLGRMPEQAVYPSSVAAAMGMSRQRVHELQKAGRLTTPQQVAEEMNRRG